MKKSIVNVASRVVPLVLLLVSVAGPALAQRPEPVTINLYPGEVPGEPVHDGEVPEEKVTNSRIEFVHVPTLTVYRPDPAKQNGTCVVICPGGGYRVLAIGHEGYAIADWLNDHGITAVILKYRMFPYRHPVPMMDVQRAIQTTRANAEDWGIQRDKIGILGFSAGGHLASTASTHILEGDHDSKDVVQHFSSRPDFAVLLYPVITINQPTSHGGSARNLLGPEPSKELIELMSNEKQVTEQTPPTLLVHSHDDGAVPIANSQQYLAALHAKGVSGTLIEFGTGGHGYGLGRPDGHETAAWPGMCIEWMKVQGLVEEKAD